MTSNAQNELLINKWQRFKFSRTACVPAKNVQQAINITNNPLERTTAKRTIGNGINAEQLHRNNIHVIGGKYICKFRQDKAKRNQ
mmetsp:Transcript_15507/g.22899  ORF Transcript_15507/g.22899 Transcript_15507/m.22899 type:complete len:85 (-) Transcript_15507:1735-1989(-)